MKITTMLTTAALALVLPALASAAFEGHIQPKDDERCLARVTGGVGLEACGQQNQVNFGNPGQIAFGDECVFVQIVDGQGSDPWKSGTRLMVRSCSDPEVPASHGKWVFDASSQQIRAQEPPTGPNKCLSIEAKLGNLRGVIKNCDEFGVTQWRLTN